MKDQKKATLYALIAIGFWSTMSSAFKLTLEHIDFANLLFYASVVSCLALLIIILIQRKTELLFDYLKHDLWFSAIISILNPLLYYLVLFKAYSLLKAQEAGTLNYIWPVVLVLLSIPILKQKISYKSVIAILISFLGLVIISTNGNVASMKFEEPLGVALAVGSAFFWALFFIYNLRNKKDEIIKLFYNFLFGSLYILIYILVSGKLIVPDTYAFTGAIYIGLFEMGITYLIWLKALKYSTNTAKVSNLVFLSPFIALGIIRLTVGEHIMISTFVGLLFIVGGILLQKFWENK